MILPDTTSFYYLHLESLWSLNKCSLTNQALSWTEPLCIIERKNTSITSYKPRHLFQCKHVITFVQIWHDYLTFIKNFRWPPSRLAIKRLWSHSSLTTGSNAVPQKWQSTLNPRENVNTASSKCQPASALSLVALRFLIERTAIDSFWWNVTLGKLCRERGAGLLSSAPVF